MIPCEGCQRPVGFGDGECGSCGRTVSGAGAFAAEGARAFERGEFRAAAEAFARAEALVPEDSEAIAATGHALFRLDDRAGALVRYERARAAGHSPPDLLLNLARLKVASNDLRGAERLLAEALERPDPPGKDFLPGRFHAGLVHGEPRRLRAACLHDAGLVRWNLGDVEGAREAFSRAIDLAPELPEPFRRLGTLHFHAGDHDAAMPLLRAYLALPRPASDPEAGGVDPAASDARYRLGMCLLARGEIDEAIAEFRRVLRERPGHAGAIYQMNALYHARGELPAEPAPAPAPPVRAPAPEDVPDGASTIFDLVRSRPTEPRGTDARRVEDPDDRPIVGRGVAMQRALRTARLAAASDASVLVTGENGSGKELVARAIHRHSPRRAGPFVPINCAAIPEPLLESELFGHERGAFTGAHQRRAGLFEVASGGAVFLDEIGDLPPPMQVKLLRFLQDRMLARVGGRELIKVDVRILAATNRRLEDLVAEGLFREDLYYRLNVLPIHVPPLRERIEDVPLLVDHFVRKYGRGALRRDQVVSDEDLALLLEHDWPGNVRELENLIERTIVLGAAAPGLVESIARRRRRTVAPGAGPASGVGGGTVGGPPPGGAMEQAVRAPARAWKPLPLEEVEREHVLRTLDHVGGNRSRAAALLGIHPVTLWRKLKDYGIASGAATPLPESDDPAKGGAASAPSRPRARDRAAARGRRA